MEFTRYTFKVKDRTITQVSVDVPAFVNDDLQYKRAIQMIRADDTFKRIPIENITLVKKSDLGETDSLAL